MWGAGAAPPPPYGTAVPQPPSSSSSGQKNDIFVGNLAFNTTEEQLHQAFSEVGRVLKVRLVTDSETGKPRGFAFVEFQDAQAALSAIRNMNEYELNGRRLRVNFSSSSHLETLAGKLGMDLSQNKNNTNNSSSGGSSAQAQRSAAQQPASAGTNAVADSLKNMNKGEMYDVVAKLKEIADRDPDEARRLLSSHPQLPEAMLFLMSKLDMVKTPIPTGAASVGGTGLPTMPSAAARPLDPRQATAAPTTATDPRQAARSADPRQQAAADPRSAARNDPRQQAPRTIDPRQAIMNPSHPPPPLPPPGLDPALVQQVMSLTPQQIQQLPPEKQADIMQLRQRITGGR